MTHCPRPLLESPYGSLNFWDMFISSTYVRNGGKHFNAYIFTSEFVVSINGFNDKKICRINFLNFI